MRTISSSILVVAIVLAANSCARQPAFKPVATVKQIMAGTVDPMADVLFQAVGTIISEKGVEEIAPRSQDDWVKVRDAAVTVAESGNLLLIGNRPLDQEDWVKMSQALVDAGVVAWKAAEARNPQAVFDAAGELYGICQQCHQKYWKEDQGQEKDPKAPR